MVARFLEINQHFYFGTKAQGAQKRLTAVTDSIAPKQIHNNTLKNPKKKNKKQFSAISTLINKIRNVS